MIKIMTNLPIAVKNNFPSVRVWLFYINILNTHSEYLFVYVHVREPCYYMYKSEYLQSPVHPEEDEHGL